MPSPGRTRGEYAKTAVRRQEILAAALEVFSADGYRKGSLREIAARAGLTLPGLLHHFPSKDVLLQALLEWRDEDALGRIGAPEGVDQLRALLDLAKYNEGTPELVELHVTLSAEATSADHPVHDYFVRRYAMIVAATQRAFEHAAGRGQLRPGVDPQSAARSLVALWDGLQVQWLLDRESVDVAAELRHHLTSLLSVPL